MTRIAVLVSGGGTNLQALLDAWQSGQLENGEIACVLSSRSGVYALERAHQHGVEGMVLSPKDFRTSKEYNEALLLEMELRFIDLIVLGGFLSILDEPLLTTYENRILNVHPSLIPSFCGPGQYGIRVHQAALDCGVKITGATVHFVNNVVDGGKIVLQKAVDVLPGDTPESLQRRVMEQAEWELLPQAVAMFCRGEL